MREGGALIDQVELARQTAGDAALQLELLTLFLAQLTSLAERIDAATTAPSEMSAANLPSVLHRVRGAALAVGARDLAIHLGRVEQALTMDPASRSVLEELRAQVLKASTLLAHLIAAREGAGLAKAGESR